MAYKFVEVETLTVTPAPVFFLLKYILYSCRVNAKKAISRSIINFVLICYIILITLVCANKTEYCIINLKK